MTPAERRRFENCLVLAKRGATAGERAAGLAAAERIAASAGITLAQAKARAGGPSARPMIETGTWAGAASVWPVRARPRAKPRKPPKPPTVADRLREKAEIEADRRRRTAAADRRLLKELAEQEAWLAEQRELQAARDRAWAASRGEDAVT